MSNPKRLSEIIAADYPTNMDAEICQAMNAKTIPVTRETFVTDRTLLATLGATKATPVKVAFEATTDPGLKWMWEMLRDKGIDINMQESRGIIQSLVDNTDFPLVQEDADKLFALAEYKISRAEQEGLGTVTGVDVRSARRLI